MSVTQRGKDTFLVRVHVGRDPITKKRIEINETVHGSRSYAMKREAELKAKKFSGQLIKPQRMTVDALFDRYLDSARHTLGVATCHKYNDLYRRYASPYVGSVLISKLKRGDIQQLLNFLLDPKEGGDKEGGKKRAGMGLSASTVRFVKAVLKSAFEFAIDSQLITDSPVSRIKLPPCRKPRSHSLTTKEVKAFISVRKHSWYGDALVFQLYTGLRTQELTALIWDDVDFDKGTLRVERACKRVDGCCVAIGSPKTENSYRVIDISPGLLKLLRCHHEAQQKVIETHEGPKPYGDYKVKDWVRRERPGQSHLYTRTDLIFPSHKRQSPARYCYEGIL